MSPQPRCIGQPLSWLALERYQLGELSPRRSRSVALHLQRCDVCRRCFEQIETERVSVELPPLPLPERAPPAEPGAGPVLSELGQTDGAQRAGREQEPRPPRQGRPRRAWWLLPALGVAGAIAAASLLLVLRPLTGRPPGGAPTRPGQLARRVGYKGGELAVALVRERRGRIEHRPRTFAPGDRFKVLVTCPPGPLRWELVVLQDGRQYHPLRSSTPLSCGNRVALPGAFRLDGHAAAEVCLLVGGRRAARDARSARDLPARTPCIRLRRAED